MLELVEVKSCRCSKNEPKLAMRSKLAVRQDRHQEHRVRVLLRVLEKNSINNYVFRILIDVCNILIRFT